MNKPIYAPTYKCELCGDVYQLPKNAKVKESDAIICLSEIRLQIPAGHHRSAVHDCKDGSIGWGRIIGMTYREDGSLPPAQERFCDGYTFERQGDIVVAVREEGAVGGMSENMYEAVVKSSDEAVVNHSGGHLIEFDGTKDEWVYSDNKEVLPIPSIRPCKRCGNAPTEQGHDFCLSNLPGVANACCGHGVNGGYIQFEDGTIIEGDFTVIREAEIKNALEGE